MDPNLTKWRSCLKAIRDHRHVPLPGSLLASYGRLRGIVARLACNLGARPSEPHDALAEFDGILPLTLLVGDRLQGVPKLFAAFGARRIFGAARRHRTISLTNGSLLDRRALDRGTYGNWGGT